MYCRFYLSRNSSNTYNTYSYHSGFHRTYPFQLTFLMNLIYTDNCTSPETDPSSSAIAIIFERTLRRRIRIVYRTDAEVGRFFLARIDSFESSDDSSSGWKQIGHNLSESSLNCFIAKFEWKMCTLLLGVCFHCHSFSFSLSHFLSHTQTINIALLYSYWPEIWVPGF